jgi:hypothetical protein
MFTDVVGFTSLGQADEARRLLAELEASTDEERISPLQLA